MFDSINLWYQDHVWETVFIVMFIFLIFKMERMQDKIDELEYEIDELKNDDGE